jgi:hypothetical protein
MMDNQNNRITAEDINSIRNLPESFKWNYWNNNKDFGGFPLRIRNKIDPPEKIVDAEVLKYVPNLLAVIHQSVLKRPQTGHYEDGSYRFARARQLFEDYVMIMSFENMGIDSTDNGYAAYRIHPKNSVVPEEIFASVDMPESTGRFSGADRESRGERLDEMIGTPRFKDEHHILFKEGNNLVICQNEVKQILSDQSTPLFNAQLPEGYAHSMLAGENLLTKWLITFKSCLDELHINYRK